MVELITTIMFFMGTYLLLFKTGWCMTHLHLYGMRKYSSSMEYCKPLKMSDLALVFHYLKMMIFSIYLMIYALGLIVNPMVINWYIVALFICDGIIYGIVTYFDLISIKHKIKGQWRTQTKISDNHDDEVTFVNAMDKLHYTIPYTMLMAVGIMVCDFFC